MVQAKTNKSLMWPRGDTYTFRTELTGLELTEKDYLMFAICDGNTYETVYSQFAQFDGNAAIIEVPSSATSVLEPGDYYYDLRILRGVEVTGDAVTVDDADKVWSLYAPKLPALTLTEVARNV